MDLVFVFEYEHLYLCILGILVAFSQVLAAGLGVSQGKTQDARHLSWEGDHQNDNLNPSSEMLSLGDTFFHPSLAA